MTKSKRVATERTTKHIVFDVNKMLKPFELSIKPYNGNSYNIERLCDFDELIKRKNKRNTSYV